jgi:hypothetical protein
LIDVLLGVDAGPNLFAETGKIAPANLLGWLWQRSDHYNYLDWTGRQLTRHFYPNLFVGTVDGLEADCFHCKSPTRAAPRAAA